jgi:amino acid transporter, AAT family
MSANSELNKGFDQVNTVHKNTPLHRGLKQRHITLMSLGSAIGVGLFLGSATAIKLAGPSILLAYIVAGIGMFFIMRALGEMAIQNPVAGSFSRYAQEHISPLTGFITGWNYWFVWVVTCMGEITAIGVYMDYWFPGTPGWVWALAALVIMSAVNFINVKAYGEFEFWFALIKIVTIILMIVIGLLIILFGVGNGGVATGIHNLWTHGGFFAHGFKGFLFSFQIVMFAYLGIEMIGLTAGEVENPEKTLAKAIDNVFWRILIFYVGTLFVVMSIYRWNEIGTSNSPFVLTFEKLGIRGAAGIINFVVLTAALSSCNTGIFSTGRMLFNLAEQGQAPRSLGKVTKSGIPANAVIVSSIALLVGVVLNLIVPAKAFTWITSIATVGAIWTWAVILLSQIGFRRKMSADQVSRLKYKTPLFPLGSYLTLAFLVIVVGLIAWSSDTRIAIYVGIIWYAVLTLCYLMFRSRFASSQK